ncbi:hypothetical protein QKT49_gp194 [Acanthamoeba castellanii medusavirus]|uniref:C962R-like N-terminal AEP domain-containing protein n=1 Tax=Acanthamoeba castellanii medusavirus J1 TaxID=3114988 RepID=A0A3T1CXP8_9VIRU|nr:hypothetical protein QKT49_gp194 [Acanthamoeba castellanii medusavirus]BBI30569.1 hypothetical protein [Acanthamoeba castellanii medusavirus J1]
MLSRRGLSAAEADILDGLFDEAESMEEEAVVPPPELPESVEEVEVEEKPPPVKKAKTEKKETPRFYAEEWDFPTEIGATQPEHTLPLILAPTPSYSPSAVLAFLRHLCDRELGRLQRTCMAMHRLVSRSRIWEERTKRLLERSFNSNIMSRAAAAQWEKRCASLPSAKARYDLLKFYEGQVGLAMVKKKFIKSSVITWAEQWHPLEKDEQRDEYYQNVLNRRPPRAQTYWRPVQDPYLKSKGEHESHLIFTGGVLYVPASRQNEFRYHFLKDLRVAPSYIGERRTAVFPLFGDLDMSDLEIPSQDRLDEYYRCMQEVVAELFPDLNDYERRMVICQAPISFEKPRSRRYKTGVHVYWPGVMLTATFALVVRKAIIKKLRERFGERPLPDNPWVKVLDEAVYTSNGLRMFGSFKADKCRECRGAGKVAIAQSQTQSTVLLRKQPNEVHPALKGQTKFDTERTAESEQKKKKRKKKKQSDANVPKEPCGLCLETGKTHVGRLYEPVLVLDGSGEPDDDELQNLKDDAEALYDACTLRHPTDTPTVEPAMPEWLKDVKESDLYDGPSDEELRRLRRKDQTGIVRKGARLTPRDADYRPVKQSLRGNEVKARAMLMDALTTANDYMRGGPTITRIEYESTGNYYIAKTDCKWCPNKGDEHTSSTIWFRVGYHTITTHCFSRLPAVRPIGGCACRDMERFDAFGTPVELKELLFPDMLEAEREHALLACRYSAPTVKKEEASPPSPPPSDSGEPVMVWNTAIIKKEPVEDTSKQNPKRKRKRKTRDEDDAWGRGGGDVWAGSAFD